MDNPCQREKERALKAGGEWELATEAARRYVITKPLDPELDLAPKSPEYLEEMQKAFEREAAARKAYIEAMTAWHDCEKVHSS